MMLASFSRGAGRPGNRPVAAAFPERRLLCPAHGCRAKHEHTDACHAYGFHDLRRAFATENAPNMSGDALKKLVRHKSYLTTQVYVNLSRQLDTAVECLHVPEQLKRKKAGE
jgi:integrase